MASKTLQWILRTLDGTVMYSYIEFSNRTSELQDKWNFFAFSCELRSITTAGQYELVTSTFINGISMGLDNTKERFYFADEAAQPVTMGSGEY